MATRRQHPARACPRLSRNPSAGCGKLDPGHGTSRSSTSSLPPPRCPGCPSAAAKRRTRCPVWLLAALRGKKQPTPKSEQGVRGERSPSMPWIGWLSPLSISPQKRGATSTRLRAGGGALPNVGPDFPVWGQLSSTLPQKTRQPLHSERLQSDQYGTSRSARLRRDVPLHGNTVCVQFSMSVSL